MKKVLFSTVLVLAISTLLSTNQANANSYEAEMLTGGTYFNEYYLEDEAVSYTYLENEEICKDFIAEEDLLSSYMEGSSETYEKIAEDYTEENEMIVYVYDKNDKDCVDFVAEENLLSNYMESSPYEYQDKVAFGENNKNNIFKTIAYATTSFFRNLI